MFKVVVYVPTSHVEVVKQALFSAGAGKIGDYEQCCWQIEGRGQFCPSPGAKPYLGTVNKLECVSEYKLELVCDHRFIKAAVKSMIDAHPYEEPAYQVSSFLCLDDLPGW